MTYQAGTCNVTDPESPRSTAAHSLSASPGSAAPAATSPGAALTGRERVRRALKCLETDRAPWVPFTGCHAGSLIGLDAEAYLRSEDAVVRGVGEAIRRYRPDGVPVVFDLQIEAETFGCALKWAAENPPSVISHPLVEGETLADLRIPAPTDGRIAAALGATRRLRADHPDLALYGLITGPFTLALHLLGTDIFMRMFDDPESVKEVLAFAQRTAEAMAGYYIDAGCDVVAVVDPMVSQIGPDQFREYVTPYISPVFDLIRTRGALGSFFVCGHAQQNIKAMCECRPDNVSVDENIPLDYVKSICLEHGISFGGNLQLTTILLLGTPEDAERNALECLEVGGTRGYVLAPGCDLPYAAPPANAEAVARVAIDPYAREVARARTREAAACDALDMREYGQTDRVIVDIVTLDSEGCAPCQYMVESVKAVAPEFEGIVEWREHKIKYREALVFMTSLMVKNIPTICIDGRITFVSRIPAREELVAALQKRIYEKLRMRIRRHHATLHVLGDGGEKCREVEQNVRRAVTELGSDVEVAVVTAEETWHRYGVLAAQTPAVVLTRSMLKSTKSVPEVSIVKEWIKDVR